MTKGRARKTETAREEYNFPDQHPSNAAGKGDANSMRSSVELLARTPKELADAVRCGRSTIYAEIKAGRLVATKIGRRTVITNENSRAWLRSLPVRAPSPEAAA